MIGRGDSKMNELFRHIMHVDKARVQGHNQLVQQINKLNTFKDATIMNKYNDILKEYLTHSYSKATAYNNVIMVAGYVAFFTMWSAMKSSLSVRMMILSALSMSISAAIFVLSQVYNMIKTVKQTRELNQIANNETNSDLLIAKWKAKAQEIEMSTFKAWPYFLYSTLVFALLGLGLLFASFIHGLIATFIP